jgi:phosphate ABC transporter phosphate-binding protein
MAPRPKVGARWRVIRRGFIAAAAASSALCAALLAPPQSASAASFVQISGAGSTWSYNAINDWRTNVAQQGMVVNYNPVGSDSGLQEFANGTIDWAASDIPYGRDGSTTNLPPARGYTYMPDTAGGVALMYNLHIGGTQVTNLRLSGAVIAGIFTNQITMWNDPKIAADNPGLTLPAEKIIPVVRTDGGGGATWVFTQWMNATQSASWTAYCAVVGLSPCVQVSAYPVQAGTNMIGNAGDLGVSGYVAQASAEGAIGITEYAYALESGFPVAKVLNAAGYYTAPTPDSVGVSLLNAQVNTDQTENLSQVYTDTDPRTYELSYYSYMILPTDSSAGFSTAKGNTLGAFGSYLLCQGQLPLNAIGYAALPVNLVDDAYAQLQKVLGNALPATAADFIGGCANPTFAPDGTNLLARNAPNPPACDQQGPTQCTAAASGLISITATLAASPNPATVGGTVTLTTTESATDGTTPASL